MPSLRDIIYLDRVRVESFVSQLAGGLTIQEGSGAKAEEMLEGGVGANIGVVKFSVGGKEAHATTLSTTRIPAYAILGTVEAALNDADLLKSPGPAVLPGHILKAPGEMTLESWGLLASLADNLQGAGLLGAKVYSRTRGEKDMNQMRQELRALEKALKRKPGQALAASPDEKANRQEALAKKLGQISAWFEILTDGYIDDVKEIIKLFFQDQHHIRLKTTTDSSSVTLIGLLRDDGLVGSTMEELIFAYGARPSTGFTMLAQVTESARAEQVDLNQLSERFAALRDPTPSLGLIQRGIRVLGGTILEIAEELRRPAAEDLVFVVPLAVYREVLQ